MRESEKLRLLKPAANAIFEIAKQLGMIREIDIELSECSKLFQDEDIKNYFSDKLISKKEKRELIEKRLKPIVSDETYTFVSILAEHNSIDMLPDILLLYKGIVDDYNDLVRVRIVTAYEADDKIIEDVLRTIKCFSNSKISYETEVDESIIGGIVVYVGSTIYDYSIKKQVELLQNKFTC